MASAYSIARTYNEFVPPLDLELFYKGLQAKQTAYDQNFAFIQTQIDAAKSLDIVKQSDQKYAAERLGQIVEQVNNYGNIDLTSSSVARQVSSHVKQVLDDNVKNAISSTKEYRNFTQRMEELRKTNKAAYNQINEAYALRGFRNYLDNEEVGEVLKPINYSEYRDVQGKSDKLLKEAFEMYGVTKEQEAISDWEYLETEVQGIQQEKIRSYINSNLDAADRQQLAINGWYNYSLENPEKAKETLSSYSETRIKNYESAINQLKEKKDSLSIADQQKAVSAIKLFESKIDNLKEANEELETPEQIGAYMELERIVSSAEEMFSERVTSSKYTPNQAYSNKMSHELSVMKYTADLLEKQKTNSYDNIGAETYGDSGNPLTNEENYELGVGRVLTANKQLEEELKEQLGDKYDKNTSVQTNIEKIKDPETKQKYYEKYITNTTELAELGKDYDQVYDNLKSFIYTSKEGVEKTFDTAQILYHIAAEYKDAADTEKPYYASLFNHIKNKNPNQKMNRLNKDGKIIGQDKYGYLDIEKVSKKNPKKLTSYIDITSQKKMLGYIETFVPKERRSEYLEKVEEVIKKVQSSDNRRPFTIEDSYKILANMGLENVSNEYKTTMALSNSSGMLNYFLKTSGEKYIKNPHARPIGLDPKREGTEANLHSLISTTINSDSRNNVKFDKNKEIQVAPTADGKSVRFYQKTENGEVGVSSETYNISGLHPQLQEFVQVKFQDENWKKTSSVIKLNDNIQPKTKDILKTTVSALKNTYKDLDTEKLEHIIGSPDKYSAKFHDEKLSIVSASNQESSTYYTFSEENESMLLHQAFLRGVANPIELLQAMLADIAENGVPNTLKIKK
jgi:DNA-binding ferritin-like protein (Dps family)